jgi:prolyl-tRNA editing enzyme YbaK/EbsC (Cys-tRNA(Pro) deacylase)
MTPTLGSLSTVAAAGRPDLLAPPVAAALSVVAGDVGVAEIDGAVADTAAFCAAYAVAPAASANCVVLSGKREGSVRYAAAVVLATTRADVNGTIRRLLDVRKISFAPMEDAVHRTGMEYGGITPVGLPVDWPVFVDSAVTRAGLIVVGSGLRRSKLVLEGSLLATLPTVQVVEGMATSVPG